MPDTDVSPLVAKQKEWMKTIIPAFELSSDNREMMDQRNAGKSIIDGLDADKADIRDAFLGIEVRMKGGVFGGKKKSLLDKDGDYRNEIDTVHHSKKMKEALTPDQSAIIKEQLDKIHAIRDQLAGNPYYDPGERPELSSKPEQPSDMSDADYIELLEKHTAEIIKAEAEWEAKVAECDRHLTEDLWTPMVREGIIPENFVPQKHSEVAQLFENAATAYDKRLDDYTAELTDADLLQQKFDLGFKIGKSVLKLAGSTAGLAGSFGEEGSKLADDAATAAEVFEYMGIALTLGEGVSKAVITEKDFVGVGLAIADAAVAVIGKAAGDDEVAGIVSRVLENGARAVRVGQALNKKPPEQPDYEAAFMLVVGGITSELENNDPEDDGGLMTDIAGGLSSAAAAAFQAKNIAAMVKRGDPPLSILSALMDAGSALGEKALTSAKVIKESDEDEDDGEGVDEEALTLAMSEGTKMAYDKFDQAKLDARQKEMDILTAERLKESAEYAAEAEREEFEKHLRMGFPVATTDQEAIEIAEFQRVNSIEYLIAMQKKNEATFKMAEQIASKGIDFVAKLFPPAKLVAACMTLALTIKKAVEETQEMIMWRETVADAVTAVSPQVDAMMNRSGLQTKQAAQANVQVGLDAAKVVAEVLLMTPAAPAAPIVSATVETVEAAIELADLIYTEAQLSAAWKIYQEARKTPEDRYLARKAMRENPTLSKYAMAYGALNGDPIAVEGMRKCGLNKQILQNTGKNVDKVVSYLESKYSDDPVLLRAVPPADKWHPGPVTLSASSWMQFYSAATTLSNLDAGGDMSGIAAAIGGLEEAETAFSAAMKDVTERAGKTTKAEHAKSPVVISPIAKDGLLLALVALRAKLDAFKPIETPSGRRHDTFAVYVDALRAQSETRSASVQKIIAGQPWTSKLLAEPKPEPTSKKTDETEDLETTD